VLPATNNGLLLVYTLVYGMFIFCSSLSFIHHLHFALLVRAFWGQSNEGRGVFVWVDFKYQQCFSEIDYYTFKYNIDTDDVYKSDIDHHGPDSRTDVYLNEHLKGEHTREHIVKVPQDLQAQKRDTMSAGKGNSL